MRIIHPDTRWWLPPMGEVWKKRELFWMFVHRQFILRYKQSILGILWAVLNPLGSLFVFWLLFGNLLNVPTDGYPYIVYAFAGLIPWNGFQNTSSNIANCLQEQMGIISKVYFPRIILPFVVLMRDFFDALIVLFLLFGVAALYGYYPTWRYLLLPGVIAGALLVALGLGLLFAGPIVRFRDLKVPLTYFLQLAMYLSPVIYAPSIIPQGYHWLLELNPMYWIILASRWCLLGMPFVITPYFYASVALLALLLFCGWLLFAYTERRIVDVQ